MYQKTRFTMEALANMMHGLVAEMREIMAELLIMEGQDCSQFPVIKWNEIEDDHSEDRVGHSFLTDKRNEWVIARKGFVLGRVFNSAQIKARWMQAGEQSYREQTIRQYGQQVEEFREKILMAMHITGGQPGQGPEVLGLRIYNTAQGGVQNVFIDRGMVCFMT